MGVTRTQNYNTPFHNSFFRTHVLVFVCCGTISWKKVLRITKKYTYILTIILLAYPRPHHIFQFGNLFAFQRDHRNNENSGKQQKRGYLNTLEMRGVSLCFTD